MDTIDTTLSAAETINEAHAAMDKIFLDLREDVAEVMLDLACTGHTVTRSRVLAQIIMVALDDGGVSVLGPEATFKGQYDVAMKQHLVEMADHMGPDWAQALYHAAVFITKVA